MKFDDSKRWVLVTGASGGIGQAICRTLAMAGFNVLAGVRPGGTIVAPAIAPHVNLIDLDLAASEQVETIRERVAERTGGSLYGPTSIALRADARDGPRNGGIATPA